MDLSIIQINSDTEISTENHFKVSAGPGAGKTHWLINHIKNTLHKSNRLQKTRKIACITYTNIAVETILKRLGDCAERVEVSTIHSFLYKNVLKPYISYVSRNYDFNFEKMDGHNEPYVNAGIIREWIESHENKIQLNHPFSVNQLLNRPENLDALKRWLFSIHYELNDSDEVQIKIKNSQAYVITVIDGRITRGSQINTRTLNLLKPGLLDYKKGYWKDGILFHDDVLFFSFKLINEYPFILEILRAKFPYFFIDEFQDSNPIQVSLLKKIAQKETVMGVIGDKRQSIYGFQGADPNQFDNYCLSGQVNYLINENKRSTIHITNILNKVREDLAQTSKRNIEGEVPTIIIGEFFEAYRYLTNELGFAEVVTLSRRNTTSNALRQKFNEKIPQENILATLESTDTNSERRRTIIRCITALEFARQEHFKEALKELSIILQGDIMNKDSRKKIALGYLSKMLDEYTRISDMSLLEFHALVSNNIVGISGFKRGKPLDFYNSTRYKDVAVFVVSTNENDTHRTIHKSKGDEFENTLLILNDEKELGFILSPSLEEEENRVNYVAISRARDRLFISVPSLLPETKNKLSSLFNFTELQ